MNSAVLATQQSRPLNSLEGNVSILIWREGLEGAVNLLEVVLAQHSRVQDGKAQEFRFAYQKRTMDIELILLAKGLLAKGIELYSLILLAPLFPCFDCQD